MQTPHSSRDIFITQTPDFTPDGNAAGGRLHFPTSLAVRCGLVNWESKQKLRDEQEITLKKAGTLSTSPVPFLIRAVTAGALETVVD